MPRSDTACLSMEGKLRTQRRIYTRVLVGGAPGAEEGRQHGAPAWRGLRVTNYPPTKIDKFA